MRRGSERCRIRTRVDGSEAHQDIQTTLTARFVRGADTSSIQRKTMEHEIVESRPQLRGPG